ncbi:MFS transporter [Arthrobacter sp. CAN_C5]|uniref:MFS transporter n=1 Tax=Arthrobacter sp. CAN_C5 TaxID=2760706 RepID=UPI001AE9800A|nr:MFS transporter [Arthrobacter sp. CAN_C5]MBP2217989.1 MFS family permease [Arthrobacter sp. CAN_C5]
MTSSQPQNRPPGGSNATGAASASGALGTHSGPGAHGAPGTHGAPGAAGPTQTIDVVAVQRRTVAVLIVGQVLGGIGIGCTLSIGAVMAANISGSDALSGTASTLSTLGAAASAIPLARLAQRLGRRRALTTGALLAASGSVVAITAAALGSFPLLMLAFALLGVGAAVNLQSRFAATDLASPQHRGRDLSLVVWFTTVGAVLGPNLIGPGETIASTLRMPDLTGSFLIAFTAQLAAAAVYLVALRPDPYLLSTSNAAKSAEETDPGAIRGRGPLIFAIGSIAISHAVMVAVMSMTPVHLINHGVTLTIIGLTISLHIAGMFALSPLFGWLSDKVGRVTTILIGQGLFAVSLPIVALGEDDPVLVTVGLVFLGLGWSAATVAGSALVADLVTGAARPKIQGRTDLIMNLAGAVGGASSGVALVLIGYAGLAWSAGVLVLVVVAGSVITRSGATRSGVTG